MKVKLEYINNVADWDALCDLVHILGMLEMWPKSVRIIHRYDSKHANPIHTFYRERVNESSVYRNRR